MFLLDRLIHKSTMKVRRRAIKFDGRRYNTQAQRRPVVAL